MYTNHFIEPKNHKNRGDSITLDTCAHYLLSGMKRYQWRYSF